jgi:glutamine synthetase
MNTHHAVFSSPNTQSVGSEIEFCLIDSKTKKPVDASVFANSVTLNEQEPFIEELYDQLEKQYISVELLHAESASGQMEVVLKYSTDPIVMADNIIFTRETIREVARKHGMIAHFTPKFDMAAAGNGMHLHVSTRDAATNRPNFCQGSSLSSTGGAFVEGILKHLPALMGLTLPTVNSYRRVGPGCWTGSVVGWGVEDKESGVRVCSNLATKEWDNVELKLIDHTSNIYLALAATLHAGLHGISQKLEPRHPLGSKDESSPEPLPATVFKALDALENDESLISMLGPKLAKAYLALRRHEAERAGKMTFDEEVQEFIKRA